MTISQRAVKIVKPNIFRHSWDCINRGWYLFKKVIGLSAVFVIFGVVSSQADMRIRAMDFTATSSTASYYSLVISSNVTLGLDCSGNASGGALTVDASGIIVCSDDDGGGLVSTGTLVANFGIEGSTIVLTYTATINDEHAIEIIVDAAGFSDIKGIDIDYITGALPSSEDEAVILINIDQSESTGGTVSGIEILTTEGSASIIGMEVGPIVAPIVQLSGVFSDMDSALVIDTDELAAFISDTVDVQMFVVDNDSVTIGDAAQYTDIEVLLSSSASGGGIAPTFQFSTGTAGWAAFSPIDGTNGMRNSGVIQWQLLDIPTWAVGTGTEYLIRIIRTRNSLSTVPIESKVQISATTEFSWDKDGDVSVNDIAVAGAISSTVAGGTVTIVDSFTTFEATQDAAQVPIVKINNLGTGNISNLTLEAANGTDAGILFKETGNSNQTKLYWDENVNTFKIHNTASCALAPVSFGDNGNITMSSCATGASAMLLFPRGALRLYNYEVNLAASANNVVLKSTDVAGSAELYVEDEAGNWTLLSPHDENGDWVFFSFNLRKRTVEYVNMSELIADMEALTGKTYSITREPDLDAPRKELIQRIRDAPTETGEEKSR